jgi:hypothetical protein
VYQVAEALAILGRQAQESRQETHRHVDDDVSHQVGFPARGNLQP